MITEYKANYKYIMFIGIGFTCLLISTLLCIVNKCSTLTNNIMLLLSFLVVYAFWITPHFITLDEKSFLFKTIFKTRKISYSDIRSIKFFYSTKSLIWEAGDKDKAHMLCFIKLSSLPLDLLMINNSMPRYHQLCKHIIKKRKQLG